MLFCCRFLIPAFCPAPAAPTRVRYITTGLRVRYLRIGSADLPCSPDRLCLTLNLQRAHDPRFISRCLRTTSSHARTSCGPNINDTPCYFPNAFFASHHLASSSHRSNCMYQQYPYPPCPQRPPHRSHGIVPRGGTIPPLCPARPTASTRWLHMQVTMLPDPPRN